MIDPLILGAECQLYKDFSETPDPKKPSPTMNDVEKLAMRLKDAKRIIAKMKRKLVEKKSNRKINANFEELVVRKMGFSKEPDFDPRNIFKGPDLNDETCFKHLRSSSAELCLVHPKVLQWISSVQATLQKKDSSAFLKSSTASSMEDRRSYDGDYCEDEDVYITDHDPNRNSRSVHFDRYDDPRDPHGYHNDRYCQSDRNRRNYQQNYRSASDTRQRRRH
uniref:Uncharacterized protein n=1 Tax=Romanomermis culicivorax TaxID=13658 RepID=A0A915I8D9_ROMCU